MTLKTDEEQAMDSRFSRPTQPDDGQQSCNVITARTFLDRMGTSDERPNDKRFYVRMQFWKWEHDWRAAEAADDWNAMNRLARRYDTLVGL